LIRLKTNLVKKHQFVGNVQILSLLINTSDHNNVQLVDFIFVNFLAQIKNTWLKQFLDIFLETSQMVFFTSSQDTGAVWAHILQSLDDK